MFKNIMTWSEKKIKLINFFLNFLYFGISFGAPLLTIFILLFNSDGIKESYRIPITVIIIVVIIAIVGKKKISKKISTINIRHEDGSYIKVAQHAKHIFQLLEDLIIPVLLLVITISFLTFLREATTFYMTMISLCIAFYLIGIFIDRLCLSTIEEDLERRRIKGLNNATK